MAELEKEQLENEEEQENMDYIDIINEMKENSVSKDKYERVLAENKKLLKTLSKGESLDPQVMAPKKPTIEEAVAPLADRENQLLSLDFAKQSLAFREAVMAKGHRDPYLPQGEGITPQTADYEDAEAMARAFQHCIEVADGDNAVFLNEFNRIYRPNPINGASRRR